jgi:hypothetical protein
MKILDFNRLNEMIQDLNDLDDLKKIGLTQEEIEGYMDFFAINYVNPLSTVFNGAINEKHQR